MPFICPYCGREKSDVERSQKHVLPKALGGNIAPQNPFSLVVCRRCNSACGRHIDGPFIRCWLTHVRWEVGYTVEWKMISWNIGQIGVTFSECATLVDALNAFHSPPARILQV